MMTRSNDSATVAGYRRLLLLLLGRLLGEPRPFARTGLHYAGGQENSDYAAALTAVNSVGVRQKLPYGGEVAATATVDFVRAIRLSGTVHCLSLQSYVDSVFSVSVKAVFVV